MWRWFSGFASRLKSSLEWYALIATAIGLPSLAVIAAYVSGFAWAEIILCVMAGIAFAFVVMAEGQPTLAWLFRIRAQLSERPHATLLMHDKPDAFGKFYLEVTNLGKVGQFYAMLEMLHPFARWPDGMFGRWSHSDIPRVDIAKGASAKICLARLEGNNELIRRWRVPHRKPSTS